MAVFGFSPTACHRAVTHVREGAAGVPVWLFSTATPWSETAALCERVCIGRSSLALFFQAQRELWPVRVALAVTTWTGESGRWPIKIAPFLTPPCRALLLNAHGDFLSGTPGAVCHHLWHQLRDRTRIAWDYLELAWAHVSDVPRATLVRARDVLGAAALAASATLLRWLGDPHRRVFRYLHGSRRLTVPQPACNGEGLVRFAQQGPDWNSAALARLAESSSARWLVWQREGVEAPVDDLLPLFEDSRTFAVSRQSHFRAWEPSLFPMAPFRTLQPGEVSRVLAPLANTIVVDLGKLAALGIQRRGLAGTAWLELFWEAAAAGWICRSVGQSSAPVQQPLFPMESAQFFWRVLGNSQLRRLGPFEPDRSRGTIAFVPALQRASDTASEKPRVLLVSPFLPYPLSHGGAVRIYNLCRALADRVDFILVAVREQQDVVDYEKLSAIFREVYVVDRDELPSTDTDLPPQVRQYESRSLRALVAELARRWRPDVLQIEYTHMAGFRTCAPEVPAVLVEHDLTFTLYRQLLNARPTAAARREYRQWRDFECRWLRAFDGVWTVSEEDRALAVEEGSRSGRTFAVPNGVDVTRFRPHHDHVTVPEALYVGSFRHLPNIRGFEKLRREVMPRVWERFPNFRLRVVAGPQHLKFWRSLTGSALGELDPRITVHGFVEDLSPLYADAAVVVVSLDVSAGTNIKVLEAMACGKPIVSTSVGCSGLNLENGHDILIRDECPAFADAVCELAASTELQARLGAQARRTVEDRFSWTAIAETALASYRAIAGIAPPDGPGARANTPLCQHNERDSSSIFLENRS